MARIRGYVGKLPEPRSLPDAVDLLKETMSERFNGLSEADWEAYARITFTDAVGRICQRYDRNLMKPLESLDLEQPLPTLWPRARTAVGNISLRYTHITAPWDSAKQAMKPTSSISNVPRGASLAMTRPANVSRIALASIVDHVDHTPICQRGDGEVCDSLEREVKLQ